MPTTLLQHSHNRFLDIKHIYLSLPGQGLLKRHSEVESLTRSLFFCFSVSISPLLNSFYSFSVSTMWIIQMAGKIEYCSYGIISENCPVRTSSADHRSFKVFGTRLIMFI